jgi:hypothetical protein
MKTCSTTKPLPIAEQVPAFEKDLANADAMRASTLSRLQGLLASKTKHTAREHKLRSATLGDDHPEVVTLKAEVAAGQSFVRELSAEADRAATGTLVADERSWILHGFVRDPELQGQPNLTVALFDRSNRWIKQLGHTCSDKSGYFQLCFAGGKEPVVEQGREVFVRVSDAKQQLLYCDKKPMKLVLGEVIYREIIISEESATCPPPSDDLPGRSDLSEVPANGDDPVGRSHLNEVPAQKAKARKARTRKKKTSKKAKPGA